MTDQRRVEAAVSDFPREDVVRVLEDVQAFLSRFNGSREQVREAVHLAQLVTNVLAKVKQKNIKKVVDPNLFV